MVMMITIALLLRPKTVMS